MSSMARRASDLNWGIQREKRNADSAGNDTAAARTGTWVEFQEFDFMGYSVRLLVVEAEIVADSLVFPADAVFGRHRGGEFGDHFVARAHAAPALIE